MTKAMDSEDRWYDAARRADNESLLQLLPARTAHRGTVAATVVTVILTVVVGFGLVFLPSRDGQAWGNAAELATLTVTGLTRFGASICLLVGLGQLLNPRSRARPWHLISGALNREEKRGVRHQISGEDLLDQNKLHLIVMIAKQHHLGIGNAAGFYVELILITVHWALITTVPGVPYVTAGITVVLLAIGGWMLATYRQTGAFMARHAQVKYQPTREHILELEKLYPDEDFDDFDAPDDDATNGSAANRAVK
jgi:hypothetical protein